MLLEKFSFYFSPKREERAARIAAFRQWIEEHDTKPETLVRLVTDGSDCVPGSRSAHYVIFMGLSEKGFKQFVHGTQIDTDFSLLHEFHVIPLPDIAWLLDMIANKLEND